MRYSEPEKLSTQTESTAKLEDRLRKENHELKRQIQELRGSSHHGPPTKLWHPSGVTIGAILLAAGVLIVIAFLAGYLPRQKRMTQIVAESREQAEALPRVDVVEVGRSAASSGLQVPGNIQAITEAPILARADGYLGRRFADIGDRVKAGQPLAEIEAPELDAQVRQAKANVQQAQAALGQALANLEQGKTDMELARVTSER